LSIAQHLPLIKEQISFHKYQSGKLANPMKKQRQAELGEKFAALASEIEAISEQSLEPLSTLSDSPTVTAKDLVGLPKEVVDNLNLTESDLFEFEIVRIIDRLGGSSNINKLIIALYRETGENHPRGPLATKIYRMVQKGMLYSSMEGKGIYTTDVSKSKETDVDEAHIESLDKPAFIDAFRSITEDVEYETGNG